MTATLPSLLRRTFRVLTRDAEPDPAPQSQTSVKRNFPGVPRAEQASALSLSHLLEVSPEQVSTHFRRRRDGQLYFCHKVELPISGGTATLSFAGDLLRAYLIRLSPDLAATPEKVLSRLTELGLRCDPHWVKRAIEAVQTTGRKAKIAQGQRPRAGRSEHLRYTFFPDSEICNRVASFFPLVATAPLSTLPPQVRVVWVAPGQSLAERIPPTQGQAGEDVFGRLLPGVDGHTLGLRPGPGVCLAEDGHTFQATTWGYVYVHDRVVGVRDPLTLSEDGLAVYFTYLPGWSSSLPAVREFQQLLEAHEIRRGLDETACQQVQRAFQQGSDSAQTWCLAKGRLPEDGRDAELVLEVDCTRKPGRINPDGSIDFKETHFGSTVPAGFRLARLRPATEGKPGFALSGEDLPARPGTPRRIIAGAHVEVTEEGGDLIFRAGIDGRVSFQNEILQVLETLHLPADVDYRTGNVDFSGDVIVSGSVFPGFAVKAKGSIAVQGQVENGAVLEAQGDIVVSGGIVGSHTRVAAQGRVAARFIQEASVYAGRDLTVGSYIFNAVVRSEGKVVVNQGTGRRSGTIAGGQVIAAQGIQASFAGSPSGTPTELVVGVDPKVEEALQQCQEELVQGEKELERLRRLLGLEELTLPAVRHLLQRTTPGKRSQFLEIIHRWQDLERQTRAQRAKRDALRQCLTRPASQALLSIARIIYPGVRLRLGEHLAQVQLELRETRLTNDTWTEKLFPAMT